MNISRLTRADYYVRALGPVGWPYLPFHPNLDGVTGPAREPTFRFKLLGGEKETLFAKPEGILDHCRLAVGKCIGRTMFEWMKNWAKGLKRDVVALWLAARDPRVPWYAKVVAAAVAAYALSPIDLIPDFIPILGYLDDLIIVPLGIMAAVSLIPRPIMADLRVKATEERKLTSKAGLIAVALIWIAAIALTAWLFWPR